MQIQQNANETKSKHDEMQMLQNTNKTKCKYDKIKKSHILTIQNTEETGSVPLKDCGLLYLHASY